MDTIISLERIVKVYGSGPSQVQALCGLNLEVERGEFIAVMGPSGSGKTTLLNIIGGMDKPTAGTVNVNEQFLSEMSETELDAYRLLTMGFVFQSFNLVPSLTALENIKLPILAAGQNNDYAMERSIELLELVALKSHANHRPDQMSGGEQQRIAITAALANDPSIILADEPTGNIDSKNAKEITQYFRKIVDEYGKTVIVATHDDMVARSADWICVINDGLIQSRIRPADLEQSYIGISEFFRRRLEQIDGEMRSLESRLRSDMLDGATYADARTELLTAKSILTKELERLGHMAY